MKEFRMKYRGHVCGWFRDCGCLFFTTDIKSHDYLQYDSRALSGLKSAWKKSVDIVEGPKEKGVKYPTEQWSR